MYNLDSYLKYHPGGELIIKQFNNKNCTEFFNSIHSNNTQIIECILPKYYIMDTTQYHRNVSKNNNNSIQNMFEKMVKDVDYPCICAKTAVYSNQHQFIVVNDTDNENYDTVAYALLSFMYKQQIKWEKSNNINIFSTLILCFPKVKHSNIYEFELFLFNILDYLHKFEAKYKNNKSYKNVIDCDNKLHPYTFNYFNRSFFVAGLSPHSPRKARQFKYPILVFNALKQFNLMNNLKEFDIIHNIICKREIKYDASNNYNPMIDLMSYFGEAIAFSGRIINSNEIWKCPLWWLSPQIDIKLQNNKIKKEIKTLKKLKIVSKNLHKFK